MGFVALHKSMFSLKIKSYLLPPIGKRSINLTRFKYFGDLYVFNP